jgi:hypothetical protein
VLIQPQSRPALGQVVVKCLIVGIVYASASALIAGLLGPMSRLAPTPANLVVWFLTGTLICTSLSPFIIHSSWTRQGAIFAAWAVMVCVRSLGLGIEGALFKPTAVLSAVVTAAIGVLLSLLVAWLSVTLLMPGAETVRPATRSQRTLWGWIWRVLIVGLAYFAFYFIFGATNAFLYTLNFYKDNPQFGLNLPAPTTIFAAQMLRGPLFGLGAFFILRIADAPRRKLALWLGVLLFIVGGAAPYLEVTFRTMPLGFNLATLTELFFQNFLTGVVAAYLYGME